MRRLLMLAGLVACSTSGPGRGEEPKLPASSAMPVVALASASEADGKVTIRLRVYETVPALENRTVTVTQSRTEVVDGKPTVKQVPVQTQTTVMVMKPKRWREVKLSANDPGVEVRDLAGKLVAANKLPKLLEKETAVLLSTSGPIDPFHLQLTKEGTLVILAPPEKALLAPLSISPLTPAIPALPVAPAPTPAPVPVPPKGAPKQ